MVTSQLHNSTFSAVGLEWVLIWQNLQQTTKYSRLTDLQHYSYIPRKSEIKKERKIKGKIREKISPHLDPVTVSAGGRGTPVVGVCQGACPLSF